MLEGEDFTELNLQDTFISAYTCLLKLKWNNFVKILSFYYFMFQLLALMNIHSLPQSIKSLASLTNYLLFASFNK